MRPPNKIPDNYIPLLYRTIADASAASGVPRDIFKFAKRNGCPAIRHARVHLKEFLAWWFENHGTDRDAASVLDLTQERAARERAQRLLLEQRLAAMREDYVPWPLVERWLAMRLIQPVVQWMQSAPGAWAGHADPANPQRARQVLTEMVASLKRILDAALDTPPQPNAEESEEEAQDDPDAGTEAEQAAENADPGMAE